MCVCVCVCVCACVRVRVCLSMGPCRRCSRTSSAASWMHSTCHTRDRAALRPLEQGNDGTVAGERLTTEGRASTLLPVAIPTTRAQLAMACIRCGGSVNIDHTRARARTSARGGEGRRGEGDGRRASSMSMSCEQRSPVCNGSAGALKGCALVLQPLAARTHAPPEGHAMPTARRSYAPAVAAWCMYVAGADSRGRGARRETSEDKEGGSTREHGRGRAQEGDGCLIVQLHHADRFAA
jgi:hypothetical protein